MSELLIAVNRLVNTAPNPAVMEAFIVSAIQRYNEIILQYNRPTDPGENLVSVQLWWDAAAHSREFLERTLGAKDAGGSGLEQSS